MAIKRFGDYDQTKSYGDIPTLPKGGYVLRIMGAEVCENRNGQYIKIGCDVAEGEYRGFFANEYRNQQQEDKKWHCNYLLNIPNDDGTEKDGWTKRRFKTVIEALESSNTGYHFDWDEKQFKDKLIGGLFNEREYQKNDGGIGKAINLAQLCSAEKVRSGNYKIPDDKMLANRPVTAPVPSMDDFMSIPDGSNEALPFD